MKYWNLYCALLSAAVAYCGLRVAGFCFAYGGRMTMVGYFNLVVVGINPIAWVGVLKGWHEAA